MSPTVSVNLTFADAVCSLRQMLTRYWGCWGKNKADLSSLYITLSSVNTVMKESFFMKECVKLFMSSLFHGNISSAGASDCF